MESQLLHGVTDAVATVVIHHPAKRNAMTAAMWYALPPLLGSLAADPGVRALVLTGEGGTFCAGADLKVVGTERGNRVARDGDGLMGPTRLRLSKPVIAAVAGHAVAGGLELALWCDLRVVEEDAVLGVFCRRWGVPLIDGGTQRLPRIVGQGRALDLILTGRIVPADEALAMGLVTEVVGPGRHLDRALEYADALARFPQETMLADRRAAMEGLGMRLADGIAFEAESGLPTLEVALRGASRFAAGEGRGGTGAGV